jgi:TolA-binding protein
MKNMTSLLSALVVAAIILAGCHGAEETTENTAPPAPTVTDLMQKELAATKASNDSLKLQLMKLEEANRAAVARAAELEAKMAHEKAAAEMPPPPPPPRSETQPLISNLRDGYASALRLFRSANYAESMAMFQAVLDAGAPVEMQDNCYYWMGECAYGEKNYTAAIEYFQKIFTFAKSEKKDESQIMIANSYLAMGNKAKAKAEYERLVTKFPASPYVKKAKARLASL